MIYVLLGPTASGKTSLGARFAKEKGLEIVNADAFQAYRSFPIATATPTEKEMLGVPHHLFSFLDNEAKYDIAQYQKDARNAIEKIKKSGKTPLLVGGSGLYIRSALYDYDFGIDASSVDLSAYEAMDDESLHAALEELDPDEARKLPHQNRRRVLRAIAICLASGESKTSLLAKQSHSPIEETAFFRIEIDREDLRKRIDVRVESMFEKGLVEEVMPQIKGVNGKTGIYAAIGIKEFFPYRDGLKTLDEVREDIKIDTRRYAKRQETFFRHQFETVPVRSLEDILAYVDRR